MSSKYDTPNMNWHEWTNMPKDQKEYMISEFARRVKFLSAEVIHLIAQLPDQIEYHRFNNETCFPILANTLGFWAVYGVVQNNTAKQDLALNALEHNVDYYEDMVWGSRHTANKFDQGDEAYADPRLYTANRLSGNFTANGI